MCLCARGDAGFCDELSVFVMVPVVVLQVSPLVEVMMSILPTVSWDVVACEPAGGHDV